MNHILIIDDDHELCELLTDYLGAEGFRSTASMMAPRGPLRRWSRLTSWSWMSCCRE